MAEKINFTKKALEGLSVPEKGRAYYLDTKQNRLGLTITPAGSKSFHVRATVGGYTKRISIEKGQFPTMTVEVARKKAAAILNTVANDIDPIQQRRKKKVLETTLQQALDDYIGNRDLKPGTIRDYRNAIRESYSEWMEKPLASITERMVMNQYQTRGKESKARADNAARVLGAVFRYSQARYRDSEGTPLLLRNPVDILKETRTRFRIPRKKRMIPREQFPAWYSAVCALDNPVVRDYLLLMVFTGARRLEAAKLRWEDVNFNAKSFRLADTKNREVVTLPMPEHVAEFLKARQGRKQTGWVFPTKTGKTGYLADPRKSIATVRANSKIEFSSHDLRRTFVSIAESLDLSVYTIKALVNHKMSGDVTAGYVVQTPERLAKASRRIEQEMLRLARMTQGKVVQLKQA